MTTPTSITRNSRALRFGAIGVLVALAAALIAAADSYASGKVNGVRAAVNHGTLNVDRQRRRTAGRASPEGRRPEHDPGRRRRQRLRRLLVREPRRRRDQGQDWATATIPLVSTTRTAPSPAPIPTTIAGGDGNDSLEGGQTQVAAENETYKGGDGNDTIDGGKGNDTAYLGAGNDTFRWDNGEGSDVIEGQDGTDTMVFNGNSVIRTTRDDVVRTEDGSPSSASRATSRWTPTTSRSSTSTPSAEPTAVTVNDLTGTDVTQTNVDLALTLGGNAPDGVVDTVTNATNGDDTIVSVAHADATDQLNGPIQLLVD